MTTIGIDCRLAGKQHAGIGRYIENLIIKLPQLAPNISWVFFFFDKQQFKQIFSSKPKNVTPVFAPIRHYTLAEQLKLPKLFADQNLDLLHVPHFNKPLFYKGTTIVTIHDLLWHEQKGTAVTTLPKWQYWIKYLAYRIITNQTIKTADKIIVPAQTIKQIVLKYYPKTKPKIIVTKEGIDADFLQHKPIAKPKSKTASSKQLLYVGSLYPHKNIQLVLKALSQLPNYKLLLVGSRNVFQEQVKKIVSQRHLSHQVEFLGYIPDDQLRQLYPQVTALIQPSLSEGFGLTGIEAMAMGTPVVASNIPIFKEIYQDAAFYFDPHSPKSFVKTIQKLSTSNTETVIKKGKQVVSHYSWDTMAQQTLDVYNQALGR